MVGSLQTEQLSQVISHATAPSFLLGAVAGFVSVLIGRMSQVLERIRSINDIADTDQDRRQLKADLPRLARRAALLNRAIFLAVNSAIAATLLVIIAFASAMLGLHHEPGAALIFVIALALLGSSLFTLAREVRIALNEYDHYR